MTAIPIGIGLLRVPGKIPKYLVQPVSTDNIIVVKEDHERLTPAAWSALVSQGAWIEACPTFRFSISDALGYGSRVFDGPVTLERKQLANFKATHGLTIQGLADVAGVSRSLADKWLGGKAVCQGPAAILLAELIWNTTQE